MDIDPGQIIASAGLLAIATAAAYLDVRFRTLPNWLCLICAGAGLGVAISQFGIANITWHLAHCGLALAIGMALFATRMWGGGDAKLYAAFALWFPIEEFFRLIWWISLAGLLLVLGAFLLRAKAESSSWSIGKGVPYGVAISAGAVVTWASIVWLP